MALLIRVEEAATHTGPPTWASAEGRAEGRAELARRKEGGRKKGGGTKPNLATPTQRVGN